MSKYLLPCTECNSVLTIEAGQAGQTVHCASCGADLEAPTMREIRLLKPAKVSGSTDREPVRWNEFQGLLFIAGMLVTLLSLALGAYAGYARLQLSTAPPVDERREEEEKAIDGATPVQVWNLWLQVRDTTLGTRETPEYLANRVKARWLMALVIVSGVVAALGIGTVAASILIRPGAAKRAAGKPSRK